MLCVPAQEDLGSARTQKLCQSIFFELQESPEHIVFLHWETAWLKFFWIIFKIKFESFHERWSSLVGDMKHYLRGNMKIISINILAYRCLWNNKQQKTKMLIPKRKLWENMKLMYTSHMTTPAWKPNRIFPFSEGW